MDSDGDTMFSSQTQSQNDTESGNTRRHESKAVAEDTPALIETLGLCYLGTILLRLPISLGDMHRY